MDTLTNLTIQQVAERIGLAARTVRERCCAHEIGRLVTPRLRLLSEADVERVIAAGRSRGNPNFGKDFGNGKGVPGKQLRRPPKARRKK